MPEELSPNLKELTEKAEQGDADAQFELGILNIYVTTQVHATCELSSLELSQTLALSRTKNKFIFIWAQIE